MNLLEKTIYKFNKMRLTSENREEIVIVVAYIIVYIAFVPAWFIDKITSKYFPETNIRINNWVDRILEHIVDQSERWVNDTPEKTMELLSKNFTDDEV